MERKLNRDQVVAYINDEVTYKPGWTITATPVDTDGVRVAVHFVAVDSNREMAKRGYPKDGLAVPTPENTFHLADPLVNEAGILTVLMTFLVDIEIHEAREFLRVKTDDYAAPFHPHHWSGHARWNMLNASWPTTFAMPTDGSSGDLIAEMEAGLEVDARESHLAAELLESYRNFQSQRSLMDMLAGGQSGGPLGGLPPELAALLAGGNMATGGDQGFEDDRWEDDDELSAAARQLAAELGSPFRD